MAGSGPSSEQSFTLTGANLTGAPGNITVNASASYEVSLTSGSGFASASVTVPYTAATLTTSAAIYVRLKAGLAAAAYNQTLAISGGGATSSVAVTGTVTAPSTPAPFVTSFTPASGPVGTLVTVTGTTFTGATAVTLGGFNVTGFMVVSATTIEFTVPAGASTGRIIVNGPSGFGTSASNFTVDPASNPVPIITSLAPATAVAGGAGFALTVNGTGFVSTSTATFNGVSRDVTPVSATRLTVAVLAADIATAGTYNVAVTNPMPGGGTTAATAGSTFTVTAVTPALVTYTTTGLVGTTAAVSPVVAANVTATDLVRNLPANGGPTAAAGNDLFVSSNFLNAGYDPAKFVAFTAGPAVGFQAEMQNFTFDASRSPTGPATLELRSSIDNYTTVIGTGTIVSTTALTPNSFSFPLGAAFSAIPNGGPVTFRLYGYGATGTGGTQRLSNVKVLGAVSPNTAPTLAANPATLTFATLTGQTAATQTYTLSAANLAANATISISSSDPAVLLSLTGGAPFAQTASATTSASGTLSQVVTVQFTAPATAGTTSASISNTDGTRTATVAVTGTATVPPAPTISGFSPGNGPVGTVVTITGTGFVAGTAVAFNGTAATAVTVVSATSIQATVPTGTTTGTISVSNANGTATSTGTFTVTTPAPTLAAGYLLLEDDFNYVAGTRLTANGWTSHSGASSNDAPTVLANNLTKATYPTGPTDANTNRVRLVSSGDTDVNRGFVAPAGQNTLYYSALLTIPATVGANTDYFLHFMERTGPNPNFRGRLSARPGSTAGTFNLGLGLFNAPAYAATDYAVGQTYLVVVKYVFSPGGTDLGALYVFDNAAVLPTTEPTTPDATISAANVSSASLPDGVAIRQSSNAAGTPTAELDGIRVATGWGTVVGNPTYTEATATINAGNYYRVGLNNAGSNLTPAGAVNVEGVLDLANGLINTSTANSLTLYQTATTTGGSASSFVNGPLACVTGSGAATTFFPIGKGTAYRPLTLTSTAQTSTTTYTGEIFNTSARSSGLDGGLTRVSNIRYATLTPNAQPIGFSGTLTLAFGLDDFVNAPQENSFVMAKRDGGGNWQNIGRTSATGAINGGVPVSGDLTSGAFTAFSDFALASTAPLTNNILTTPNPLPVELTVFNAQRQPDNAVAVRWTTASEQNSARFEVQRSAEGREFGTIATVAASGTSSQPTIYAALDKTAPAGTLYYRLRQVDRDGSFAFSPVAVVVGGGITKVLLFPNPAHSRLNFFVAEPTSYRVLNQLGQVLLRGTTEAGTASISIETLVLGLYFLELQTPNGRVVQKFEKQ